jgi:hypothetical protein
MAMDSFPVPAVTLRPMAIDANAAACAPGPIATALSPTASEEVPIAMEFAVPLADAPKPIAIELVVLTLAPATEASPEPMAMEFDPLALAPAMAAPLLAPMAIAP